MSTVALLIISFIIAVVIVRVIRGIFMKIIGANFMLLNGYKQFVIICIVAAVVFRLLIGG